jgi:hypothetical protein
VNGREVEIALARSNELDRWQRRLENNWVAGFAAGEAVHADDYSRGYAQAIADVKKAEHELVTILEKSAVRWVVRGQWRTRATFAEPHPADFEGGQLPLERPGLVFLGGHAVHRHAPCCWGAPALPCRSYSPGLYPPAEAARILATLPGNYAEEIARLTAMAAQGGEAA